MKKRKFRRVFFTLLIAGGALGVIFVAPFWWTGLSALTALGMALDG